MRQLLLSLYVLALGGCSLIFPYDVVPQDGASAGDAQPDAGPTEGGIPGDGPRAEQGADADGSGPSGDVGPTFPACVTALDCVGKWCLLSTPPGAADLEAVWGTEPKNVWAVGAGNAILQYDYDSCKWVPHSPTVTWGDKSLHGVWTSGPKNVVAVGQDGAYLRWDGVGWTSSQPKAAFQLRAVWGDAKGNVHAVGDNGAYLLNEVPQPAPSATAQHLNAVFGDGNDLYIAGQSGTLLHQPAGGSFAPFTCATASNDHWYGIWAVGQPGAAGFAALVVGAPTATSGHAVELTGTTCTSSLATGSPLYGVFGPSKTDLWLVGAAGQVFHVTGSLAGPPSKQTVPTTSDLKAVWASSSFPRMVVAVGAAGTVVASFDVSP
jgi:hypothetical protein